MTMQCEELINETTRQYGEPSSITHYESGQIKKLVWQIKSGTSLTTRVTRFNEDGTMHNGSWVVNNLNHRDHNDEPATVSYNEKGEIRAETWMINGEIHRGGDLPAIVKYGPDNHTGRRVVTFEYYYERNVIHRLDAPAEIEYYHDERGNRTIAMEAYRQNGRLHRSDGPARTTYYTHSDTLEEWFLGGNEIKFEAIMAVIKYIPMADAVELKLKYGG